MNWSNIFSMIAAVGIKVIVALVVLVIGFKIIKKVVDKVDVLMSKKNLDKTLIKFVTSLLNIGLKVLLILGLCQTVGIDITSFAVVLGAVGFALGMALQGTLSNFAAGVILIILKPYKIGDFVELNGLTGTVKQLEIFSTILNTVDNKVIIIPNGNILGTNIVNYSVEKTRRVDFTFGVGYEADIKEVKELLVRVASSHEKVLKDPAVFVGVSELADSSVNFALRVWVESADYWTVYFELMEQMKEELDKNNINIPYPHVQVVK